MSDWRGALARGQVIPAHPLALTNDRQLDERRQRALSRYYIAAGAGGLAVGVHTTQFEIRDEKVGLLRPVLELAAEVMRAEAAPDCVRIAGAIGPTAQAVAEAALAQELGYHAVLLSLAALKEADDDALIDHVIAVKIAPFNRYQTIEVLRAVARSGRGGEIALYTGNDDNIVLDLLTPHVFSRGGEAVELRFAGGLLGHWAAWTKAAVELLDECHALAGEGGEIPRAMLTRAIEVTDTNAAFFDAAHGFKGCIAGIHEVLRRQGLLEGIWCLDEAECLSPGQAAEIDRVYEAYPHLNDDAFVEAHRDEWLR